MREPGHALNHLDSLEAEAIHILREAVAESSRPVLLFSGGKDSTVLAHLARRAFYPARPPLPLLHIDSTWEFRDLLAFRNRCADELGFQLIVFANESAHAAGVNPFDDSDRYTTIMRTEPLKTALDRGGYDVIIGGARRDEDRSRAKERIVSIRGRNHAWDPRCQRPELWNVYNLRLGAAQTARVFPISNWTEIDILSYALSRGIDLAPLYFASERPVVPRDGSLIVVDDPERMRLREGEQITIRCVRFRTLGCWPVTSAVESAASTLSEVLDETLAATRSERSGRVSDREAGGSLERQKREGYF
ncbi:MAG TPA: sulfate adenylyltransferase subunit CysD [Rhodanobacteraceae bacterium]